MFRKLPLSISEKPVGPTIKRIVDLMSCASVIIVVHSTVQNSITSNIMQITKGTLKRDNKEDCIWLS